MSDLQISPNTVKRYIEILEQVYLIFRVTPFHKNVARAILKEPKVYFYDICLIIGDDGKKLENLVALHLLKHLHFLEDTEGVEVLLHYIRDRQGHEVDFLYQVEGSEPKLLEIKLSDHKPDKNLIYFKKKLGFVSEQVVLNMKRILQYPDVRCVPVKDFFDTLAC